MHDLMRTAYTAEDQAPANRSRAADQIRAARPEFRQYESELLTYLETHHSSLMAHEWCHILQALAYPALYLRVCDSSILTARANGPCPPGVESRTSMSSW